MKVTSPKNYGFHCLNLDTLLTKIESCPAHLRTLPDSTGVIFGTRDYRVTFVVKRATENFICVTFEDLHTAAGFYFPQARCFVTTGSHDASALRIKANLRNFPFMALKNSLARAIHRTKHPRCAVSGGANQLRTRRVEGHVKDLIVMSA